MKYKVIIDNIESRVDALLVSAWIEIVLGGKIFDYADSRTPRECVD